MKRSRKKKENALVITMLLLCFFTCLIDLVYNDYFYCDFLWEIACRLEGGLANIGFERRIALSLLNSSLGLVITMFTFVLNLGKSFFERHEHKIYGIPYGELYPDKLVSRKVSYIISMGLPIFIVIVINLELCGTSYMLLLCSYVMVFYNFGSYGKSYDKESLRGDVVDRLIACAEKADFADDQLMEYDAMLDDICRDVWDKEGRGNTWLLLDDIVNQIMRFSNVKAYVLACHLWEFIFTDNEDRHTHVSLVYIKKFIRRIGKSDAKYEDELIILWSLLCGIALRWHPQMMRCFLEWFTDIANRSGPRSLMKEAGMVILMLEFWFRTREENLEIKAECADKIYEYGRKFFLKEEEYSKFLAILYQKQYEIENWDPSKETQILCMDFKYGLNNSLFRMELNI